MRHYPERLGVAGEIAAAADVLSRHRLGMLLLLNPSREITGGVLVDAIVTQELLIALVIPEHVNKLHGGAIIMRDARIAHAGVPLTWAEVLERAAELGSGAAIRVDEVTGEIRIADQTRHVEVIACENLVRILRRYAVRQRSRASRAPR